MADSIQHGRNIWIDDGQIQSDSAISAKAVVEQFAVGRHQQMLETLNSAATQLLF